MQRFPIGKYLGINIFLWGFFLMLQGMESPPADNVFQR